VEDDTEEDDIRVGLDAAPVFDPAPYPRTYQASLPWRLVILACGCLLAAGAVCLAWFSLTSVSGIGATVFLLALASAFFCLGLYGLLYGLRNQVVLGPDGIEVISPLGWRTLRRDGLRGLRMFRSGQGFDVVVLVPQDARAGNLTIPLVLKTDEIFYAWFRGLTNLDAEEALRSKAEILETFHPELPPEEWLRRLGRQRTLGTWVNGVSMALVAAGFFVPDPTHLLFASLAALPWIAIVLVAKLQPLYGFAGDRNDERVDLTIPLILPGLVATLQAVSSFNTLEWQGPLMLAFAGGVALTGAAARIDPSLRRQRWGVPLIGLFTCAYGYGTGLQLNVLADRSTPREYQVRVLDKHVSESSHVKSWYLTVEPWGPLAQRDDIGVSEAQYQRTRQGDTVCVLLRSGALQIAWYQLDTCS
jgi:hypothetical protein